MTYQSSPMYPLIFPDQAAHLNRHGVQPLKATSIHHAKFESSHTNSWRDDAHKLALAKAQNTKDWQRKMLKEMPSVKGTNAYTTKRHMMGGALTTTQQNQINADDIANQQHIAVNQYNTDMSNENYAKYLANEATAAEQININNDVNGQTFETDSPDPNIIYNDAIYDTPMGGSRVLNGLVWNPNPAYQVSDSAIINAINILKATTFGTANWAKAKQNLGIILGTTNYSLMGGRSAEMQDKLNVLLKNRSGDYDEVTNASFYGVSPDRLFNPMPEVNTFGVDAAFADLASSLDIGDIKHALSKISSIINSLMTNADKLPLDSLESYVGVVRRGIQVALAMRNETFLSHEPGSLQKNKAIVTAIIKELEGLGEFLEKFVTYANRPLAERTSLLANIRKNLLADVAKNSRWTIT